MGISVGIDFGSSKRVVAVASTLDKPSKILIVGHGSSELPVVDPLPNDGQVSPQGDISFQLKHLKEIAERDFGEVIDNAVIGVPLAWTETSRQRLWQAALHGGFDTVQLLAEPVAAAIARYTDKKQQPQLVLTYDLGASKFETAIVEIRGGDFTVLHGSFSGDICGTEFDHRLALWMWQQLREQGYELPAIPVRFVDDVALTRLLSEAERVKRLLCVEATCNCSLEIGQDRLGQLMRLDVSITRRQIEEMIKADVNKTIDLCHQMLAVAGLSLDDIEDVLLLGGCSQIPLVRRRAEESFHQKLIIDELNSVAIGAAELASRKHPWSDSINERAVGNGTLEVDVKLRPWLQLENGPFDMKLVERIPTSGNDGSGITENHNSVQERLRRVRPPRVHISHEESDAASDHSIPSARVPQQLAEQIDFVHFSVTSPTSVPPGATFIIDVWAHLEQQRKLVLERARQAQVGLDVLMQSKGPVAVTHGTILSVRLKIEGLVVSEPKDTILWQGEIGNARFPVNVPKDAVPGSYGGFAGIYVDGLRVAKLWFTLQVGQPTSATTTVPVRHERHLRAFASYAREDLDQVLGRLQGMQKASPTLDIFLDVANLRSGQNWEQELYREISRCDVFYLFWSNFARQSQWVDREWHCALERRGIDFIDPVPLVDPKIVPPPTELASKHFNDWVLAFIKHP